MRILFTGGGTAGHINPALAAAGYFKEQHPEAEILFVGNRGGMEERLVPPAGYAMECITISGFQRKLTPKNIVKNVKTVTRLFSASQESKRILQKFRPDVCVGTGGYVCGPVLRTAAKMGIPCVVHESNAFPGVTVKMLSKSVKTVMLPVEEAKQYFEAGVHTVVTGNPVRPELLGVNREAARRSLGVDERPLILSFGGSLGATKLNEAMLPVLCESAAHGKYQHIHGYGYGADNAFVPEALKTAGVANAPNLQVREYIKDMATCMAAADLIISRAGAMTVAEIEAMGKASLLIPSPNVAENHQYHNAMVLVNRGAAEMLEEKDLTAESLSAKIDAICAVPGRAAAIAQQAKALSVTDAGARIYAVICEAMKK